SFPEKHYHRTIINYSFKSFLPLKQGFLLFHQSFLAFKRIFQCYFVSNFLRNIPDYSLETCNSSSFITLDKGFFFYPADFPFSGKNPVPLYETVFSSFTASRKFLSNLVYILGMDYICICYSASKEIFCNVLKLGYILGNIFGRPVFLRNPKKCHNRTVINYVFQNLLPFQCFTKK